MNNKEYIKEFFENFTFFEVNGSTDTQIWFDKIHEELKKCKNENKKLIFIGNGASASMSSHYTLDFWKNGSIRAINFNDHASLTAIGNDINYDEVFSHPLKRFGEKGDILISISSSGNSPNIIKALETSKEMKLTNITFSGMKPDNKLRNLGDYNIYYPGNTYGFTESAHHLLIHCILDRFLDELK